MKTLTAIVEYSENNLSAYLEGVDGIVAIGHNMQELRDSMNQSIEMCIEGCKEFGREIPEEFTGDYEIVYKHDTASFLSLYSKVLPKSGLEKLTGVNQKLLWHYASGRKKPKAATKEKIAEAIREFGRELANIQLA